MPLAMAPALEQLCLAARTWHAPGFLSPEGGEAEYKVNNYRKRSSKFN